MHAEIGSPVGLSVMASTTNCSDVLLTWNPPSNNGMGYNVYADSAWPAPPLISRVHLKINMHASYVPSFIHLSILSTFFQNQSISTATTEAEDLTFSQFLISEQYG